MKWYVVKWNDLMRFLRAEVFRRDEGDAEIGQVKDSWTAVFEPAEVSVSEREKQGPEGQ